MSGPANPRVLGFDTETPFGYVGCLAVSSGSAIETRDTDTLLTWLYERGATADYNVFWNLGFDSAAILKQFVVDNVESLREGHYRKIAATKELAGLKAREMVDAPTFRMTTEIKKLVVELDGMETVERFDTARFHIQLVGAKALGVKPLKSRKKTVWFFDAAVFYQTAFGGMSLEKAAQSYLGEGKSNEAEGLDRAKIGSEDGYYTANRDAIVRYCIRDAELTARLMEKTLSAFEHLGFSFPEKPFSKGSVSKQILKDNHVLDATQAAYERLDLNAYRSYWRKSYQGGVFLLCAGGTVENVTEADINSAYPWALLQFPSLEGAEVIDLDDPRFPECYFRFYKIEAKPTPRLPLKEKRSLRKIYGYADEIYTWWVAAPDLASLTVWGDAYRVVDGCGILCPNQTRPFAFLSDVFSQKTEAKNRWGADSIEYLNVKIVANGFYGILAQRRPREGRFTNLIYASYTTALCRQKLWAKAKEITEGGGTILQYATDGLLFRGGDNFQNSDALGEWSIHSVDRVTLFESGVYVKRKGDRTEVKKRGFPDLTEELLRTCPTHYWDSVRSAPIKLKQSIIQRRAADIGVFLPVDRTLCPVKSYFDAGQSYPSFVNKLPLSEYFHSSWLLKLKGEK